MDSTLKERALMNSFLNDKTLSEKQADTFTNFASF